MACCGVHIKIRSKTRVGSTQWPQGSMVSVVSVVRVVSLGWHFCEHMCSRAAGMALHRAHLHQQGSMLLQTVCRSGALQDRYGSLLQGCRPQHSQV